MKVAVQLCMLALFLSLRETSAAGIMWVDDGNGSDGLMASDPEDAPVEGDLDTGNGSDGLMSSDPESVKSLEEEADVAAEEAEEPAAETEEPVDPADYAVEEAEEPAAETEEPVDPADYAAEEVEPLAVEGSEPAEVLPAAVEENPLATAEEPLTVEEEPTADEDVPTEEADPYAALAATDDATEDAMEDAMDDATDVAGAFQLAACSETLALEASVNSTGFVSDGSSQDANYGPNQSCEWMITAPEGYVSPLVPSVLRPDGHVFQGGVSSLHGARPAGRKEVYPRLRDGIRWCGRGRARANQGVWHRPCKLACE
jgi:hypothetical protein